MPVDARKLVEAISILADEQNIRVTIKQAGLGSLVSAACSFIGGVLLGPAGLAIGGAAGGLVAYSMTKDSFRPLSDVLRNLSPRQRNKLVQLITDAFKDAQLQDLVLLLSMIANNASVQKTVLKTVSNFVANELHLTIID